MAYRIDGFVVNGERIHCEACEQEGPGSVDDFASAEETDRHWLLWVSLRWFTCGDWQKSYFCCRTCLDSFLGHYKGPVGLSIRRRRHPEEFADSLGQHLYVGDMVEHVGAR